MAYARVALLALLAALPTAAAYAALGDYMPVSNVQEQSHMGLDTAAFVAALRSTTPDFARASAIYRFGGGNSCKSPISPRKLQDFALANLTGEGYYDTVIAGGMQPGYWDAWMMEGLNGTGRFAGLSAAKRANALRNAVYGLVIYYAAHELEQAVMQAANVATRSDNVSAKYWDEGWAFYRGADVNGTGTPWFLTLEYDTDFPDGLTLRTSLVPHFNKGQTAVRAATYNASAALEARATIYSLWAILPLRASLKYLQLVERAYTERQHGEGYGHYMGIDGWLNAKSPAAAQALRRALDIRQSVVPNGTFCATKLALEQALPALGIDCSMLGNFRLANTTGIQCPTACSASRVVLPPGGVAAAEVSAMASDINCTAAALQQAQGPTTTTGPAVQTSGAPAACQQLSTRSTAAVVTAMLLQSRPWR